MSSTLAGRPCTSRTCGAAALPARLPCRPVRPLAATHSIFGTASRPDQQQLVRPWLASRSGTARRAGGSGARVSSRCPPAVTCSAQRGQVELLLDAIPGKSELLSPKLNPDVRRQAEKAIQQRGGRVTIGDVASSAGLSTTQAEEAMRALAADSQATLQVSNEGEIVWVFPPGFQDAIRNKSLLLRMEPAFAALKAGAAYLTRVAFGTALISSVVVVYAAIAILISSSSNSRDDNRQRGSSGFLGGGGGYYYGGPRVWFDLTDLLWYWDPWYYRHRRQRMMAAGGQQEQQGMNFLEAIFSFVFGDGDPNEDYDERRWKAVGRYIQSRGGVVVAEELAPFLDLKPGELAADRNRIAVDESYMLPVLARFNGQPEVDAQGNIVYVFPELQRTARASARRQTPPQTAALEERWQLTAASGGQQLGTAALGAVNFVGVAALTFMLADPMSKLALARNGLLWLIGAMPFLQAYAVAFFALPLARSFLNKARNAQIDARNAAREAALRLLRRPDTVLQSKLAAAAQHAQQQVIGPQDVIYSSDRPLEEQPKDLEAESFEARLERRARERQQAAGAAGPPQQQYQRQQQQQWDDADGGDGGDANAPQWWREQQAQRQRQRQRDWS